MARHSRHGQAWTGKVGYGGVRFRRLGEARRRTVWQGKAWLGRRGKARFGLDGTGEVWQAGSGTER